MKNKFNNTQLAHLTKSIIRCLTWRSNKFRGWRTFVLVCALLSLAACTGTDNVGSNSSSSGSTSQPGSTPASSVDVGGDALAGAKAWIEHNCNTCHGTGKNQGASFIDPDNLKHTNFDGLVAYIAETMPKSYGPEKCVGECAVNTAQYMLSWGTDIGKIPTLFSGSNLTCSPDEHVERPSLVRLSPAEYVLSLKDLFNLDKTPSLEGLQGEERKVGFLYSASVVTDTAASYSKLAKQVTADLISDYTTKTGCDIDDSSCAEAYIASLAERAFRIPVKSEILQPILDVYDAGKTDSLADGVQDAIEVILQSPFFLYRPSTAIGSSAAPATTEAYTNASRLSYLLTGSIPDDALWAAAKANELNNNQLIAHAQRLLATAEAREYLSREFLARWLKVKNPTGNRDDLAIELRQSYVDDALTFILETAWGDEGSLERLFTEPAVGDADTGQLIGDNQRTGILTQTAWTAHFSQSARTEPINRGVFFVEDLLCREVPVFAGDVMFPEPVNGLSLREQLRVHRENPACASCHALFDPMGLAFEVYDKNGEVRSFDRNIAIETSGILPTNDGRYEFTDVDDLLNYVADTKELRYCAAKHWMAYAYRVEQPESLNCELEGVIDSAEGFAGLERMIIETLKQTAFFGE